MFVFIYMKEVAVLLSYNSYVIRFLKYSQGYECSKYMIITLAVSLATKPPFLNMKSNTGIPQNPTI